jgi:hypothetical protein
MCQQNGIMSDLLPKGHKARSSRPENAYFRRYSFISIANSVFCCCRRNIPRSNWATAPSGGKSCWRADVSFRENELASANKP